MSAVLVLSLLFSSRTVQPPDLRRDRLFPIVTLEHPPGTGLFLPGSFALSFFVPSIAGMAALNGLYPSRFRALKGRGANVFYYIAGVLLAILEVAADTVLPILELPAPWGFRAAVSIVNAGFIGAVGLATVLSEGAEREW